jgi:hypothetical protein
VAPLPLGEITQRQRSDGHANQSQHVDTPRRQQAADVPVAPLVQHHFQPGVFLARTQQRGPSCLEQIHPFTNTGLHRNQHLCIRLASHLYVVGLVQMHVRFGDACGPDAVVAEQQQAFAGLVQPSHRPKPWQAGVTQQVVDRVATALVGRTHDDAAWLVQGEVDALRRHHGDTIQAELLALRLDRVLGIAHHATVHVHTSRAHRSLGLAARAHAQLAQHAGDAMPLPAPSPGLLDTDHQASLGGIDAKKKPGTCRAFS